MTRGCLIFILTGCVCFNIACRKEENETETSELSLDIREQDPSDCWSMMSIDLEFGYFNRLELNHNEPERLIKELQDERILYQIALSTGLTQAELDDLEVVFDSKELEIKLFLTGTNEPAIDKLYDMFDLYVNNRFEGHSKEYTTALLDYIGHHARVDDSSLKELLEIYPNILPSRVKMIDEEEAGVNGQIARQVNYVIIDGNIAWRYPILYFEDGSFKECFWDSGRCDAKEYDPQFKDIIEQVNQAVNERMERENIRGIGSIHAFWHWKKEYLKAEGIDWKSPAELNPNSLFD